MKKIIVAGNWKSNKSYLEAKEFIAKMNQLPSVEAKTIIAVPSIYADILHINNQKENISIALQNSSAYEDGAYTGEISARMIASLQLKYSIVGHSERRQYFSESDDDIAKKAKKLLEYSICPIVCVGETLDERRAETTFNVIRKQLLKVIQQIDRAQAVNLIIAYEPVWAIGTGSTASVEQAQEVHQFIFNLLNEVYGVDIASNIPILYGGSCNEKNAEELFLQPNIWGGLIGGASLNIDTFYKIMQIADKINGN